MIPEIQTAILIGAVISTVLLIVKAFVRKDPSLLSSIIPRLYLVFIIILDITATLEVPSLFMHIAIIVMFIGDMGAYLSYIFSKRYLAETLNLKSLISLKNLETKYAFIVEHAPVGVYAINSAGMFEFTNKALEKILCYTNEELLKMTIYQLVPDSEKEALTRLVDGIIRSDSLKSDYILTILPKCSGEKKIKLNAKRTVNGHITITGTAIELEE